MINYDLLFIIFISMDLRASVPARTANLDNTFLYSLEYSFQYKQH